MSYILDALRKAEHERNLGDTPRLSFTPLSDTGRSRPWVLWGLVALLGICVGVLGAMQLAQMGAGKPSMTAEPVGAEPAAAPASRPASTEPKVMVEKPVVAVDQQPESGTRQVQVNTPKGPVAVDMPLMPETRAATQPPPPASIQPQAQARPVETKEKLVTRPSPSSNNEVEDQPSVEEPAKPALVLPSAAELAAEYDYGQGDVRKVDTERAVSVPEPVPEPEQDSEPEERIMTYNGLPAVTRNSIGELTMNAHVYSSTRGRGFVMINGSRYRTGDRLSEGPELEEIRQEGAVLNYRGQRFLLPVPR